MAMFTAVAIVVAVLALSAGLALSHGFAPVIESLSRADMMGFLLTLAGLVATVAGVAFAAAAYYNINHAERIVERRIAREIHRFRQELARHHAAVQEATQKIIAGYHLMENDLDRAIALFQSAVKVFPEAFNGYTSLGYAYLKKGDTIAAMNYFQEALRRFPDRKEPYNDIARVCALHKSYDMAMEYIKKAIAVDESARHDIWEDPAFDELRKHEQWGAEFRAVVQRQPVDV